MQTDCYQMYWRSVHHGIPWRMWKSVVSDWHQICKAWNRKLFPPVETLVKSVVVNTEHKCSVSISCVRTRQMQECCWKLFWGVCVQVQSPILCATWCQGRLSCKTLNPPKPCQNTFNLCPGSHFLPIAEQAVWIRLLNGKTNSQKKCDSGTTFHSTTTFASGVKLYCRQIYNRAAKMWVQASYFKQQTVQ